jgi:hypothetical protein
VVALGEPLMLRRRATLAALAMVFVLGAGCAQKPQLYRWGVYEDLVYQMYAKPGKADPVTQAARLAEDVTRTEAEGKRVPPGVHAHLGYMYFLTGNVGAAYQELVTEREKFPESAIFIDGMLERLRRE